MDGNCAGLAEEVKRRTSANFELCERRFQDFFQNYPHLPAPLKRGDNGGIIDPFSISSPTKIG